MNQNLANKDTNSDKAVFDNYRAALNSFPRTSGTRAGERKQRALKVVAERRGLPISNVKKIVQRIESERGITHEHTKAYSAELHFAQEKQQANDAIRAAQKAEGITDGSVLACELCRSTDPKDHVSIQSIPTTYCDDSMEPVDADGMSQHYFIAACDAVRFVNNECCSTMDVADGFGENDDRCATVTNRDYYEYRYSKYID